MLLPSAYACRIGTPIAGLSHQPKRPPTLVAHIFQSFHRVRQNKGNQGNHFTCRYTQTRPFDPPNLARVIHHPRLAHNCRPGTSAATLHLRSSGPCLPAEPQVDLCHHPWRRSGPNQGLASSSADETRWAPLSTPWPGPVAAQYLAVALPCLASPCMTAHAAHTPPSNEANERRGYC